MFYPSALSPQPSAFANQTKRSNQKSMKLIKLSGEKMMAKNDKGRSPVQRSNVQYQSNELKVAHCLDYNIKSLEAYGSFAGVVVGGAE